MSTGKSSNIVFGKNDNGIWAGIPRNKQLHTGIFGEVGSGKSVVDTIMINQNINRDEGFMVVDPHGTLAQDVLRMIPESKKDKVVYISMDAVRNWGKTVKINPLEVKNGADRYVVAMNLVNALRNIYRDSWGPQLEALLRNGANALVEIEGSTLRDLVKIITDDRQRSIFMNKVANRDVRHFWNVLFPVQYQKDAGRSAYNKLDKILSTPQVAAILDAPQSTIDFTEIIESGKFVIIDLSSGGSDDVISFLGTILINMVYIEARKRFGRQDIIDRPFFMYIDEAHLFAPFALRELLNTMRKANIKVTIATQTINTFPREFAKEITALVKTVISFKVDMETANTFKTIMPVSVETLTSMTQGRFAYYSQGNPPDTGLLIASHIIERERDWKFLARYSVEKYGEATTLEKYIMPTKAKNDSPQVTPLEASILLLLFNENRDMTKDEIYEIIYSMFAVDKRDVMEKLDDILVNHLRLVERKNVKMDDGDGKLSTRYVLSTLAYNSFFSQAALGRRAGSPLHLATIFMIMQVQQKAFKFCIPDLGDKGEQRPDLLIFEPQRMEYAGRDVTYEPLTWSERIIAVEVETDPTKHEGQVVENFRKNFEIGYDVLFVVFSEKHKQYIKDAMTKNNILEQHYKTMLIQPESVEKLSNTQNNSVTHLTREELEVYNALKNGGTAKSIADKIGMSTYDVMGLLWRLEAKGITERSSIETKKTVLDTRQGKNNTVKGKQEYFIPTEEGKKLASNEQNIAIPWDGIDIEFFTCKQQYINAQKQEIKAERYLELADLCEKEANRLDALNNSIADNLNGTTIHEGQYSESKHRKELERMQLIANKALNLRDQAQGFRKIAENKIKPPVVISEEQKEIQKLKAEIADGIDFAKLTTAQLKSFVTIPKFSSFAKQMLENRGYTTTITGGEAKFRKKPGYHGNM